MCKINGKRLAELRKETGIPMKEIAKRSGVSMSTIAAYEKNESEPKEETIEKICLVLNINKDDIIVHDVGYSFTNGEGKTTAAVRKRKGFIRYSTPRQTEKWIDKRRKADRETEIKEVKTALKNSFGLGSKKYILIDPTFIHVPAWQRDTDMAKVTEIAENFNEDKFDPVKAYVSPEGILIAADGVHRVIALIINEEVKILTEILNCTENEAVLTFLGQQSGRKTMTVNDTYRAGVKANIKEYTDFKLLFEENNIQITADEEMLPNPVGKIRPSGKILRMVASNRELLSKELKLIKKLEWCGSTGKNAFVLRNIEVIKRLYANYGEDVEEKLLKHCKGADYYESKIVPIKSNAKLYDMLSAEINK